MRSGDSVHLGVNVLTGLVLGQAVLNRTVYGGDQVLDLAVTRRSVHAVVIGCLVASEQLALPRGVDLNTEVKQFVLGHGDHGTLRLVPAERNVELSELV